MAFWRTFTPSSLDKLLEEEVSIRPRWPPKGGVNFAQHFCSLQWLNFQWQDYTLDQLLDEDEFVQECKHCCNQTLLELCAPTACTLRSPD